MVGLDMVGGGLRCLGKKTYHFKKNKIQNKYTSQVRHNLFG